MGRCGTGMKLVVQPESLIGAGGGTPNMKVKFFYMKKLLEHKYRQIGGSPSGPLSTPLDGIIDFYGRISIFIPLNSHTSNKTWCKYQGMTPRPIYCQRLLDT